MKRRIISAVLAVLMLITLAGCDSSTYKKAEALYESGDYAAAQALYNSIPDHKDAAEKSASCQQYLDYDAATAAMTKEKYEEALEIFAKCPDVDGTEDRMAECYYALGTAGMAALDYTCAIEYFEKCQKYSDAADKLAECQYILDLAEAKEQMYRRDYASAAEQFEKLSADDEALDCRYLELMDNLNVLTFGELAEKFAELGTYRGSDKLADIFSAVDSGDVITAAEKADDFLRNSTEFPSRQWWQRFFAKMPAETADEFLARSYAAQTLGASTLSGGYVNGGAAIDGFDACHGDSGKVIVCYKDSAAGSNYLNISAVTEELPAERMAKNLAETQYVVLIERGHTEVSSYDSGTIGVMLWMKVSVYDCLTRSTEKVFGTAYGNNPPDSFTYTGIAPSFKSGDAPGSAEVKKLYCQALEYLGIIKTENNIEYTVNNGEAAILGLEPLYIDSIPETLGGCPVTRIAEGVYCGDMSSDEITVPDTVRILPTGFFKDLIDLKHVHLPENLEEIPENCFAGCRSLETIELSEGLKAVNANAFFGCSSLKTLELPSTVRYFSAESVRYSPAAVIVLNEGLRVIEGISGNESGDETENSGEETDELDEELLAIISDTETYNEVMSGINDYIEKVEEDPAAVGDFPKILYQYPGLFSDLTELSTVLSVFDDDPDLMKEMADTFVETFKEIRAVLIEARNKAGFDAVDTGEDVDRQPMAIPASVISILGKVEPDWFTAQPYTYAGWYFED